MPHPVSWFQISGKNGKKLQSFYKKLFAWTLSPGPKDLMLVARGGADGIPGGVGASRDGRPGVTVYVTVESVEGHLQKAEASGGRRVLEPTTLPDGMGTVGGIEDPEGNFIGLWQSADTSTRSTRKKPARKKTAKSASSTTRTRGAKKQDRKASTKGRPPRESARTPASAKRSKR